MDVCVAVINNITENGLKPYFFALNQCCPVTYLHKAGSDIDNGDPNGHGKKAGDRGLIPLIDALHPEKTESNPAKSASIRALPFKNG